jgi:hypothetical protein
MRTIRRPALPLLVLTLALLAPAPVVAATDGVAVGARGIVYKLRQGTYGALIPDAPAEQAENMVLALDVVYPDGTWERLLVPETEGPEVESDPALTLHRVTGAPYLIWASRRTIHSKLFVIGLTDDGWTPAIELSGEPFSTKSRPQLVVTSKRIDTLDEQEAPQSRERTVFHVVWWDDGGWGRRVLYTPLVLDASGSARLLQILPLTDFLPAAEPTDRPLPPSFYETPRLLPGKGEETVLVAFADAATARLATIEIALLPEALFKLATDLEEELLRDAQGGEPPTQEQLAERARAQIVILGLRLFQPEVVGYLAETVAAALRAAPASGAQALAERARAQVVILGASLRNAYLVPRARAQVVILGLRNSSSGGDQPAPAAYLAVRTVALWEAPALPQRPVQLFVSGSGEDALVAWDAAGSVRYVETDGEGWSEVGTLLLTEDLDRADAYQLLRRRVNPR